MRQLLLPIRLKCVNPTCSNEAARNDWFCGMECYERVRILGLASPKRDYSYAAVSFAAGMAIACAALA
jgi:hypothetical protein